MSIALYILSDISRALREKGASHMGAKHIVGAAFLLVATYYFREELARELRRWGWL